MDNREDALTGVDRSTAVAGRELDIAVALGPMGWKSVWQEVRGAERVHVGRPRGQVTNGPAPRVPSYSASVTDAGLVMAAVAGTFGPDGDSLTLCIRHNAGQTLAWVEGGDGDPVAPPVRAPTLPLAVARAAMLAHHASPPPTD